MKIFQVDAFTEKVFGGNPAAVVPLDAWPDDSLLQAIAAENNLAETAFLVSKAHQWELRWFTPAAEVALCGHATLAAAYVLVKHLNASESPIEFLTRESGLLRVVLNENGSLSMSFPAIELEADESSKADIEFALGQSPARILRGAYSPDQFDYVAVFENESDIASLTPDVAKFKALSSRGIIATAKGEEADFVSRYFAPNFGIPEDPVTGSAHCLLAPFWSGELKLPQMTAFQLSNRFGTVHCALDNDRVVLTGFVSDYMQGVIGLGS